MVRRYDQRGQASVEWVLVLPLLMLLVLTGVQVALWAHAGHIATAAAQEGVVVARSVSGSADAGESRARNVLDQMGRRLVEDPDVAATLTPTSARVDVRGRAIAIIPLLRLGVHGQATSPLEAFGDPRER
ncbi:MAG: TadE/TadG family type IV pilus assembly protein [Acidimicrobiales bacterium]